MDKTSRVTLCFRFRDKKSTLKNWIEKLYTSERRVRSKTYIPLKRRGNETNCLRFSHRIGQPFWASQTIIFATAVCFWNSRRAGSPNFFYELQLPAAE